MQTLTASELGSAVPGSPKNRLPILMVSGNTARRTLQGTHGRSRNLLRMWIMLRDQIDYEEFCRRGQKQSGAVCAGVPEVGNGANRHRPVD